jgi:hypothetical protein
MVIQVEESVLISIFAVMFIPLFLFFIRIYVRVNQLTDKLDTVITSREKVEVHIARLNEHDSELRLQKMRLDNLEKYKNGK